MINGVYTLDAYCSLFAVVGAFFFTLPSHQPLTLYAILRTSPLAPPKTLHAYIFFGTPHYIQHKDTELPNNDDNTYFSLSVFTLVRFLFFDSLHIDFNVGTLFPVIWNSS